MTPARGQTSGRLCDVPGCGRRHAAGGFCMTHYKRARAGRDVMREPSPGDPDGHGLYGVLDDDGETVLCHECGQRRRTLGPHLGADHGITAREYKIAHGLPLTMPLTSEDMRAEQSERARARLDSPAWRRFEGARDPVAASRARDPWTLRRGARFRDSSANLPSAPVEVCVCQVCGSTWCPMPGRQPTLTCDARCWAEWQAARHVGPRHPERDAAILARTRRGESRAAIAADHGITAERVGQIVRRLSP